MKEKLTRRDFLKLAGVLPISVAVPRFMGSLDTPGQHQSKPQNVIVVVLDAFSAYDISLYGYQRETTPNLARLAERAVVYHKHYAGGNFTTPGTASLLSGMLPWKHRQFIHYGTVDENFIANNLFSAFQNHYRITYSHNPLANNLLSQLGVGGNFDNYIPSKNLFLTTDGFIPDLFAKDEDIATVSWVRAAKRQEEGYAYSLFLSHIYEPYQELKIANLRPYYPRGIPSVKSDNYFLLEYAVDWLGGQLGKIPQPFMSYFHFMPPHAPYKTHRDFIGRFKNDRWMPVLKPHDPLFSDGDYQSKREMRNRILYDEFILYVDREIGRLFDSLDSTGILGNTWVVLTSDHGEMFERGVTGHKTPVLYGPVVHIPMMVFEPKRKKKLDVYTATCAIDVLPTLLHVTGQQSADWSEGIIMPPFSDSYPENRDIYILEAKKNRKYKPLTIATIALIKGHYKLIYFFGYEELEKSGGERIELYDIMNDPEELNDLSLTKANVAAEVLNELKQKLVEVDKPYIG
ncbi:MAG: sulfatase [Chloroflexota bacterium]